jgi:protein SCO1/2
MMSSRASRAASCSASIMLLFMTVSACAESDPHAGHHDHHALRSGDSHYTRTIHSYRFPEVTLMNQDGNGIPLKSLLNDEKPVMLNIIFTTCTAICPVMTATFVKTRQLLGADADGLRMISITNDPDHDSAEVLKAYSVRHGASKEWQFLTGLRTDITTVLRSLDAYPGNKMNHLPLTFLRPAHGASWVRLEGLTTSSELAEEYRKLTRSKIVQ